MAPNPNLKRLHEAGVSIWLDTLSRELVAGGDFAALIRDFSVTGATSNPTIFAKAITGSEPLRRPAARSGGRRRARHAGAVLRAGARRRPRGRPRAATGPPAKWRPRRLHLVRMHSGSRRRHRGDDRAGERPLATTRSTQRDDQGPRHGGRPSRDRGADAPWRERQHHAAVRGRALRGGHRRLPARPDGTCPSRRAPRPDSVGRLVLPLPHRHQGRRAARPTNRHSRVASRSPARASPTSATCRSSPAPSGSGSWIWEPSRSGHCGRAPARRTRPTPTCSTWLSWSDPT